MTVTVRLYATLRDLRPDLGPQVELDVGEGTTVAALIERLGIPPGIVRKVFVRGLAEDGSYVIRPGDEIAMFPPIAGGSA
jgi:molybdopterin converting factor small subunit